jgi:monofunctional glycosyltransferase
LKCGVTFDYLKTDHRNTSTPHFTMAKNNSDQKSRNFLRKFVIRMFIAVFLLPPVVLFLLVVALRWTDPPFTSFTLREDWAALQQERYNLREWWVHGDEIPVHLKWAVVASEDQLFWEHHGFDVESIRVAWEDHQAGRRTRGASTISQQVAKNLFLSPAHSFVRKGIEAGITIVIELLWPKERIIEVYLNIAEFGPGIFGVGKAAEYFWSIDASALNPDRAARLAAVLPSPKRMRAEPPSPYAYERSRWILRQMSQLTGIRYIEPDPADTVVTEEPEMEDIDPYLLQLEGDLDEFLRLPEDPLIIEPDTTNY